MGKFQAALVLFVSMNWKRLQLMRIHDEHKQFRMEEETRLSVTSNRTINICQCQAYGDWLAVSAFHVDHTSDLYIFIKTAFHVLFLMLLKAEMHVHAYTKASS